MSLKGDEAATGRDYFFTPAGNNDWSGLSDETPVADPNTAIDRVNNIIPLPGPADPASINASVSGTYSAGVAVPQFVTCLAASASILTTDAVNVKVFGRHTVEWGSLLNFSDGGVCVKADAVARVAVEVNSCVPLGANGVGVQLSGVCDEVFIQIRLGDMQGANAIMFDHTASSASPIQYAAETITFTGKDQTVIRYNDPVNTTETVFDIAAAQTKAAALPFADNSTIADIIAGTVVIRASVLSADVAVTTGVGAICSVSCNVLSGTTFSQGAVVYDTVGVIFGDLQTLPGGSISARSTLIVGNAINAGAMSIKCDQLIGEIFNTGVMYVIIDTYTGNMPINDGSINGIINGIRYGNWVIKRESALEAFSLADQNPLGLDIPLKVEFGPAQGTPTDSLTIAVDGAITVNEPGQYDLVVYFQFGRGGVNLVSWMFARMLIDDVQLGRPMFTKLDGSNDDLPVEFEVGALDLTTGQVITFEIIRDSQGVDEGGLLTETATAPGWGASPSASIVIYEHVEASLTKNWFDPDDWIDAEAWTD